MAGQFTGSAKGKEPVGQRKIRMPLEIRPPKEQWQPPPLGWAKVNVDGAFSQETGKGGIGVVIRDHHGVPVLCSWRAVLRCSSAAVVEALACKEGVALAAEWVRDRVIVESDCINIVDAIHQGSNRSELCFTLQEVKEISRLLPEVRVQAVRREQNGAAHELAQLAKRTLHTAVWRTRVPSCIEHLIAHDCNVIND